MGLERHRVVGWADEKILLGRVSDTRKFHFVIFLVISQDIYTFLYLCYSSINKFVTKIYSLYVHFYFTMKVFP